MKIHGWVKTYSSSNLVLRIVIAIFWGAIFGLLLPSQKWIGELGVIFVSALKAVAPILVFILIVCSLSLGKSHLDRRFAKVILLYLVSTTLASVVAVLAGTLCPQKLYLVNAVETGAPPTDILDVLHNLLVRAVSNPLAAIVDANYIGILVWGMCLGFALKKMSSDTTFAVLRDLANAVSLVVRWIINLAPFGIMGIMFTSVSTNGIEIFKTYGSLILLLVGTMLFMAFVVTPLIVGIVLRRDPFPLILRCYKSSGMTAFFMRSSAANIPVNMALCKKLELDRKLYSVSIPLGATINMSGAAITIAIMTLAAAHTLGIQVSFTSALVVCLFATLSACGAGGVTGGSLLLIPLACAPFGISSDIAMQVVAVGLMISVVQDSLETALNSSTDVIFTATAEYSSWKKQGKELPKEIFREHTQDSFAPKVDQE